MLRRHTLLDECRILLVHGLLHLLGYDHEAGAAGAAAMERAERLILSRLGWRVRSALDIPAGCQIHRQKAESRGMSSPGEPQLPGCCFACLHDASVASSALELSCFLL